MRWPALALCAFACARNAPTSASVEAPNVPPATLDGGAAPDAGAPDAGLPDAGAPDAGASDDAGTPDAGIPDAGGPDAGATDGGQAALDCGPFAPATLAWTLRGYVNPYRNDYYSGYSAVGDDGRDGLTVETVWSSGHADGDRTELYGADGGRRLALASIGCQPVNGCTSTSGAVGNGLAIFGDGTGRDSSDGHVLFQAPVVPDGGLANSYWTDVALATNGDVSAFAWDDFHPDGGALLTLVGQDGGTLLQTTAPIVATMAVEESGVTLVRLRDPVVVAYAPDGSIKYTASADSNYPLQAAGGRFWAGGVSVRSVASGLVVATLPFAPTNAALARTTMYAQDPATGELAAIDLATGNVVWRRSLASSNVPFSQVPFSAKGDEVIFIDAQQVLHVINGAGSERLTCQAAADVTTPYLAPGGRIAVTRWPNLEVYELP